MTTAIQFKPAGRAAGIKPYFFASLNEQINGLRASGTDVIRLDMGSPDLPPADWIIDEMDRSAREEGAHRYMPAGGTPAYRQAAADYYLKRFAVALDPQTEVLGLIGSKEGLFNLSQVMLEAGDIAIVPDPGYPVYSASASIAGAEVYHMPLLAENAYLPDLDAIPPEIGERAKIMLLNYPNNPTGATATLEFFKKVVQYAHSHCILIVHDAPYTEIGFDGYRAPSLMQVDDAKDVSVEFNSLSKTYNMGGWRLGYVVGNPQVLKLLGTFKSQIDSSNFKPLMDAGVKAMTGSQLWLASRNQIYQTRRDIVVEGLRHAGLDVQTPRATIYLWAHLPGGTDSEEYCGKLLTETGVSVTPGTVYGEQGKGSLRISLGLETVRIAEAMQRWIVWENDRQI
jgi:LL-diaminopimelate aminotransferase